MIFLLLFNLASAGGDSGQVLIQSIKKLSYQHIITNYFLSHPDSKICKRKIKYEGLGQKLALATEEFKASWVGYRPTKEIKTFIEQELENCASFDACFSLKTYFEVNADFFQKEIKIINQKNEIVDYQKSLNKIPNFCDLI